MPAAHQHGVLVGPEARQHLVDEVAEASQRLAARRGPPTDGLGAGGLRSDGGQHLTIHLVEAGPHRRGPPPACARSLGRRLAVVGVEVPAAPGGVVAVHEVPEPLSLPVVEVLHHQAAPTPALGPRRELRLVAEELVGAHLGHIEVLEQTPHVVGERLGGDHLVGPVLEAMRLQPRGQRGRTAPVARHDPTGCRLRPGGDGSERRSAVSGVPQQLEPPPPKGPPALPWSGSECDTGPALDMVRRGQDRPPT